jgi:integrase
MRGCIKKRGKSWAVIVYLGRDGQGKRRYKWYTHPTRREAEAHLGQLLVQAQGGWVLPPARLRFGEYLEQWLRDYAAGSVSETTCWTYEVVIRRYLKPVLGNIPLIRLTPQAIQRFFTEKLEEGLSSTSVHKCYRVLREALGHSVRWGLLSRNPAEMVDPPRPRRREMRVWDEEQVRLFLAEARRSSPFYALYLTAILTGMRQGELLGLRWEDVDLALGGASIRQTFYRIGGRQLFKAPKSASSRRTVALPPVLVQELHGLRGQQSEHRRLLGAEYTDHGLVFCQRNGKPLHAHNLIVRDFRRIIERAGLPRIRFHDLRHCHATHLLRQGVHPKVVQERLGHSTPAITLHVYSHVLPGMQDEAARRLAERLLGHDTPGISRD